MRILKKDIRQPGVSRRGRTRLRGHTARTDSHSCPDLTQEDPLLPAGSGLPLPQPHFPAPRASDQKCGRLSVIGGAGEGSECVCSFCGGRWAPSPREGHPQGQTGAVLRARQDDRSACVSRLLWRECVSVPVRVKNVLSLAKCRRSLCLVFKA